MLQVAVYISYDVVFDETVFLFSKLNQNAGTRLCSEILLPPLDFQPYNSLSHGNEFSECSNDDVPVNPISTNASSLPASIEKKIQVNLVQGISWNQLIK
jgi:hypothetical protein